MAKRKREPESVVELSVNGHTLRGEARGGVWSFSCPDFPEVAAKWGGDTTARNAIDDFMARALAGAVKCRVILSSMEWEPGGG